MTNWLKIFLLLLLAAPASAQLSTGDDLHFNTLATAWDEGIPLGNGMVGAIIWKKNDKLRFGLDRADLWDERPMKGLHRPEFSYQWVAGQVYKNDYAIVQQYFDAPYDREAGPCKISGGALEFNINALGDVSFVNLGLQHALCTVQWKNGASMASFVHATQPIGWFRFKNANGISPQLIVPQYENVSGKPLDSLKSNDPAKLGYEKGSITRTQNSVSYHQKGWGGFYYDIVVKWKQVDQSTIEGVWSITSAVRNKQTAETIASEALQRGYDKDLTTHLQWWSAYWSKSSISIPDTLLQHQYYRDMYKFGAAARRGAPPILLQGVWTADNGKLPPWKGDYHHDLNTEMSYWPAYTANHLDEALSFTGHLDGNKENYREYTQTYFGKQGINVPGVTTLQGEEMGGWIQYALSPTVAGWLAQHYYDQWNYSRDNVFLKNSAYPWFQEVAIYFENITVPDKDGYRGLPISSSPEINNNSIDAWFLQTTNYDLSLIKYVFVKAAELAGVLNKKEDEAKYNALAASVKPFALSANHELMYAPNAPYVESHRHFSNAMAIYPLGLINWNDGDSAQVIIKNTIALFDKVGPANWNGYSYAWLANLKASAKDGEGAAEALTIFSKAFCSVNSFHVNGDQSGKGYSSRTYRPFTLEGNLGEAAALQEMLLQSNAGYIEVMPAIPASWQNVAFKTLRTAGAFLVSANQKEGKIEEVIITSEKGGVTSLKLPFTNYRISTCNKVKCNKPIDSELELDFKPGGSVTIVNAGTGL